MNTCFREPAVEEGERNIILQNRCGNRLTLLFCADRTELELVYKPNALRRKEFRARNFSNRDVQTTLFKGFSLAQTAAAHLERVAYDPFVTSFDLRTPSSACNTVTVVSIADHNAFALAARAPLLVSLVPHHRFECSDGLMLEAFEDRGEEIVSFVAFSGYEANRFRILENGECILQIFENELLLVGGEESRTHVRSTLKFVAGQTLEQIIQYGEDRIRPALGKGNLVCGDERLQQVLDLNRRIVYSGMDEGGACFGALNRIYYLMWVRDGAMTTSLMARAGNPDYLRLFAPFLLANPSRFRRPDGSMSVEFSQLIGTRWSKNEDDGVFYAVLVLFTHFVTTGDDSLLESRWLTTVLTAFDTFLNKAWDEQRCLAGSDTRGESPLSANPYFGYDVVSGRVEAANSHEGGGNECFARISRCFSLYTNINTCNCCRMLAVVLQQQSCDKERRLARYNAIARSIEAKLHTVWVDPQGCLFAEHLLYRDGSDAWVAWGEGIDYWEYAWAVSLGPWYPAPALQIRSARMVRDSWPRLKDYGFCPWNTLSRFLSEFGLDAPSYREMLKPEIDDALTDCRRYPMYGALGEYVNSVNNEKKLFTSWRALPFTAGSLLYSVTSQLLQSLPLGIAVRSGAGLVRELHQFQYRLARIDVSAQGEGEAVERVVVNGVEYPGSLQLAERMLRAGRNRVEVVCGESKRVRLYGSNASLLEVRCSAEELVYTFDSPVPLQMVFEHLMPQNQLVVHCGANVAQWTATSVEGSTLTIIAADVVGGCTVSVRRSTRS